MGSIDVGPDMIVLFFFGSNALVVDHVSQDTVPCVTEFSPFAAEYTESNGSAYACIDGYLLRVAPGNESTFMAKIEG